MTIKDLHVGTMLRAKFKNNPDNYIFGNVFLPLKITAEYPNWFLCEVQPHVNPVNSWGISKPYPMTIHKFSLRSGDVVIRPYGSGWPILTER